jgi:hypothetical protein
MKKLFPLERFSSLGGVQKVAAIVAAASLSCLPFSSALANHTGGGGGGHAGGGGGGHPSGGGGHPGGGGGGHPGGGGHGAFARPAAAYHGGGFNGGGLRTAYSGGRNFSNISHTNLYGNHAVSNHAVSNHAVSNHASLYSRNTNSSHASNQHVATANQHHDPGVNRVANASHTLNQTNKTEVAKATSRSRDPAHAANAAIANRAPAFNHSLSTTSAHTLMNQRLNQIADRHWEGHENFSSDHFDREHGCWFNHGGSWWRCNFWGANWYCNHCIALGFAPGLCWGWYDNICWGNICIGMPLDLVDYYYPDPVYSDYSDYNGDEATVYYYATDDGQYKQVTVIDGKVVDVQIVDQIS